MNQLTGSIWRSDYTADEPPKPCKSLTKQEDAVRPNKIQWFPPDNGEQCFYIEYDTESEIGALIEKLSEILAKGKILQHDEWRLFLIYSILSGKAYPKDVRKMVLSKFTQEDQQGFDKNENGLY